MDNLVKNLFGFGGLVISLSFFIRALFFFLKYRKEKKYTGKTEGKIIDNDIIKNVRESDKRVTRYYYALCEYVVDGVRCVRETNNGHIDIKYNVGQIVNVYYNPENVHEAYIEGDNNVNVKAIISVVLGVITAIFVFLAYNFFL